MQVPCLCRGRHVLPRLPIRRLRKFPLVGALVGVSAVVVRRVTRATEGRNAITSSEIHDSNLANLYLSSWWLHGSRFGYSKPALDWLRCHAWAEHRLISTPCNARKMQHTQTHTHTHTRTHTTQHSTAHKAHRGVANYSAGAVDLNAVVPSMLFRILNYRPFSQPEPRGLKAATTGWQYGFWWSTGPLRELGSGKTWQR